MAISTINQAGLNAPLTLTAPNLGTPSAINLTNATALAYAALPTGCVLQVVQGTAQTAVGVNSTTAIDTGLTATITPKSASNKILVFVVQSARFSKSGNEQGHGLTLIRGSTTLVNQSDRYGGYIYSNTTTSIDAAVQTPIIYLDSPATTSATTYKTQGRPTTTPGNVTYQSESQMSTITLVEIAG
jgi:hypothetical protein